MNTTRSVKHTNKRVFVASVATETNTFSPMPTGAADFAVIRPSNRDDNALGGDVVNTDVVGDYFITYTATDACGNTATVIRQVSVLEDNGSCT